jgi:hypothetical protein
MNVFQGYETID